MDLIVKLLDRLGWSLPWLTPALLAIVLASQADKVLSLEGREQAENFIWHRNRVRSASRLMGTYSMALEAVFGAKHWTWKCFLRSCAASLLALLFLTARYGFMLRGEWKVVRFYWGMFMWACFVPDYLSLWQTRAFVKWAERTTSWSGRLGVVVADLAASIAISVSLSFAAILLWAGGILTTHLWRYWLLAQLFWEEIPPRQIVPGYTMWLTPIAPAVASGLLTSIWLWIYAFGTLLARGLLRLEGPLRAFRRLIDTAKWPITGGHLGRFCRLSRGRRPGRPAAGSHVASLGECVRATDYTGHPPWNATGSRSETRRAFDLWVGP